MGSKTLNFLFFNVRLFPLWESIAWLILFLILYLVYWLVRRCYLRSKARKQEANNSGSITGAVIADASAPAFGEEGGDTPDVEIRPTRPLVPKESAPRSRWVAKGLRILEALAVIAGAYFLLLIAFIILARCIDTAIVIDPRPCPRGSAKSYCNYTFETPHEDIYLNGEGESLLHGWWVNATGNISGTSRSPTMLLNHGRSLPIPAYRPLLKELVSRGYDVFIYDYQGFGKSTGAPTETNMYADAEKALDYVVERKGIKNKEDVMQMGVSLGGAVTTHLAKSHNSSSVVLISSIDSVGEEIRSNLLFTGWAVAGTMRYSFSAYDDAPFLRRCMFFYVGEKDEIIPAWRGKRLFRQAGNLDQNCTIMFDDPKGKHAGMPGNIFDNPDFEKAFDEWLNGRDGRKP